MSTNRMLPQWAGSIKSLYKSDIISSKWFSPWYSRKTADLTLSNNHSLLRHNVYVLHSVCRHVDLLRQIILILSQPVFALTPYCCVLSWETADTNFIVFGLILPRFEPTIYHKRGDHNNITHQCGSFCFILGVYNTCIVDWYSDCCCIYALSNVVDSLDV
jgi:hypothetical protein